MGVKETFGFWGCQTFPGSWSIALGGQPPTPSLLLGRLGESFCCVQRPKLPAGINSFKFCQLSSGRNRWGLMILKPLFRATACPSFLFASLRCSPTVNLAAVRCCGSLWRGCPYMATRETHVRSVCKGVQEKLLLWLEKSLQTHCAEDWENIPWFTGYVCLCLSRIHALPEARAIVPCQRTAWGAKSGLGLTQHSRSPVPVHYSNGLWTDYAPSIRERKNKEDKGLSSVNKPIKTCCFNRSFAAFFLYLLKCPVSLQACRGDLDILEWLRKPYFSFFSPDMTHFCLRWSLHSAPEHRLLAAEVYVKQDWLLKAKNKSKNLYICKKPFCLVCSALAIWLPFSSLSLQEGRSVFLLLSSSKNKVLYIMKSCHV